MGTGLEKTTIGRLALLADAQGDAEPLRHGGSTAFILDGRYGFFDKVDEFSSDRSPDCSATEPYPCSAAPERSIDYFILCQDVPGDGVITLPDTAVEAVIIAKVRKFDKPPEIDFLPAIVKQGRLGRLPYAFEFPTIGSLKEYG